jgi:hypothetical protein
MPALRSAPSDLSKRERLQSLALPLRPRRPPFYVQHPTPHTPMVGWWWQPSDRLEPLATNYEMAVYLVIDRLQRGEVSA